MTISFFESVISPRAIELATEVLRSGWVSEGARVAQFEKVLAESFGLVHPIALNSGTAALHLALVMAGIGRGDEVILPAQTFVATAHAVMMQRALPVFADIDPLTGNLAPTSVRAAVTPRTRAILPVHWGGYPCDLDDLQVIANDADAVLIEDGAHAFGAKYRGRPIGSVSRFTCFSFQAIKHVTCGDGGAVCCTQVADANLARRLRWFAIDRASTRQTELGEREFDITEVGYKYHMNDVAAAIGLGNLEEFAQRLARRRSIASTYRNSLQDVAGLRHLRLDGDRTGAAWLFTVLVDRRDLFVRALAARGVPSSVVHRRIDRLTVFGGIRPELDGQRIFDEQQISLPLHSRLTGDEVLRVIAAVRQGW